MPVGSLLQVNYYLLKSIALGPVCLERILAVIPESRFDDRLSPDRFTLREAMAHLADFEPIFRGRMEVAVHSPGSPVEPRDEDQMAIDNDYAHQDVFASLARYKAERDITTTFLKSLKPEQFDLTVVHTELGVLRLEDIANVIVDHDMYHVEHATLFLR